MLRAALGLDAQLGVGRRMCPLSPGSRRRSRRSSSRARRRRSRPGSGPSHRQTGDGRRSKTAVGKLRIQAHLLEALSSPDGDAFPLLAVLFQHRDDLAPERHADDRHASPPRAAWRTAGPARTTCTPPGSRPRSAPCRGAGRRGGSPYRPSPSLTCPCRWRSGPGRQTSCPGTRRRSGGRRPAA